jgi:hypothetical protein
MEGSAMRVLISGFVAGGGGSVLFSWNPEVANST